MDARASQLRFAALSKLVRAHKPTALQLPFLAAALGFVTKTAAAAAAAAGEGEDAAAAAAACIEQPAAAPTVDAASGQPLPGCSERVCVGEFLPSADMQAGLAACQAWCKEHGALFDQESGQSALGS